MAPETVETPKLKIANIDSKQKWDDFFAMYKHTTLVAHFSASWSDSCSQVNTVLNELAADVNPTNVTLCMVEAERVPQASLQFDIVAVPTIVFVRGGRAIDRINGAHVPLIVSKVRQASDGTMTEVSEEKQVLNARLTSLCRRSKCMIFIKGTPEQPRCGFSQKLINLLTEANADYGYFDILSDNTVREGLKELSNWPTYPQMYIDGELIGGLDIIAEQMADGQLKLPCKVDNSARLTALINRAPVMVFIKGTASEPRCKFSKALMEILAEQKVEVETFDILSDQEVREQLKVFSNWPTYPQVYVKGALIGGLDIIKELKESGDLQNELAVK